MRRAFSLGCALLAGALAACQQTWKLDNLGPDGSMGGAGGASGGGKGGFSPSDASTDSQCFSQLEAFPDVPQVIVALDRSLMTTSTPLGPQDEFSTAAADLSTEVSHYQSSSGPSHGASGITISFAYLAFPSTMAGCDYPLGCCSSDVTYTPTSLAFQNAAYSCSQPGSCVSSSNRPIGDALATAHDWFYQSANQASGPRFVLLVSGGPPSGNCSSVTNDCQSAINKIDDLNTLQVTTYVVGMGDQTNDGCLTSIANEVGSTSMYYAPAMSSNDLFHALQNVTNTIAQAACHMTLATTFSSVSASQLQVYQAGNYVNQDNRNGWTLESQGGAPRLVLHGSACTNFTMGGGIYSLDVYAGCSGHFGGNP